MLSHATETEIKNALTEVLTVYQGEPLADQKRVVTPTGPGSFSIHVEPYRGHRTQIAIWKELEKSETFTRFDKFIKSNEPRLLGHIYSPAIRQRRHIKNSSDLLLHLASQVSDAMDRGADANAAINSLLEDLNLVIDGETAFLEEFSPLGGLKLPNGVDRVDLGHGVSIKRLSDTEITEISSGDILRYGHAFDASERDVTCALVIDRAVEFFLREEPVDAPRAGPVQEEFKNLADAFLLAVHLVKSGRTSFVFTRQGLIPNVLPGMSSGLYSALSHHRFEVMNLGQEEVERLPALFDSVLNHPKAEFRVASARLRDAENRLSPADALLDAVIGLEVLLNPLEHGEQAFRLALNYAFLKPIEERRQRYTLLRAIQNTRNKIVHQGLTIASPKGHVIHTHADEAKNCLRDALKCFVEDPALASASTSKLDADFWIDRIVPPLPDSDG